VTKKHPLVSVIATSYTMERLEDLITLIGSLQKQTFTYCEIIIVLEKSRELLDRVDDYIKQNEYDNVRVLFNSGMRGASAARNMGIRNARGEILAFIDDDAVATPGWLEGIVNIFKSRTDTIGVTGPILPLWENESLMWLPEEFYWIVSCAPVRSEQQIKVRNAWGNNMAFRKEAFEKGGLFLSEVGARGGGARGKHELVGEDTEFCLRARHTSGKSIICSPDIVVYHRADTYRFNGSFVASRAYWEGYTKILMKKALGNQHDDTLAVEHKLLGRILFNLLPLTLLRLLSRPTDSWQRLKLITVALSGVAFGYARGLFGDSGAFGSEACIEYL
jgi:GT2 family glycosyltransferase